MAINYSSGWVKADFLFSIHSEEMDQIKARQSCFGHDFSTHSDARRRIMAPPGAVDYFWNDLHFTATSSIAGAHVGLLMGFPEVILCGVPMDSNAYYQPSARRSPYGQSKIIAGHVRSMERFAATIGRGLVFSLSGLTKKMLGPPPEVPIYGH